MKCADVVFIRTILVLSLALGGEVSATNSDGAPATSDGKVRLSDVSRPAENLIALVGRRIAVRYVKPNPDEIPFDAEYRVKVEVLQILFGSYSKKEITFSSYVHIGPPAFEESEFGLVYVSEFQGRFVQQKYLFQALYPTADGRLAGCGDPYAGMADMHRHGVKAEPVTFHPAVVFPTARIPKPQVARRYPEPFFQHRRRKAVCVLGNYPAELFQVMKEGYLTARGVFGPAARKPMEPSKTP